MSVRSINLYVVIIPSVSLLILFLGDSSIVECQVLTFPTIILLLSISPFSSDSKFALYIYMF